MKNKKGIIAAVIVVLVSILVFFIIYKVFNMKNNNQTIYENFSITKVTSKQGGNRKISLDSSFIVETDKSVNEESIRNRIFIEPSIDYKINKVNSKKYEIKPTEGLVGNEIYTVQEIKNKTAVYKWAFETEPSLSVIDYSPYDYAENNDVIQLTFSTEEVENIEKYVKISPSVAGKWEKINNAYIFKPNSKLKDNITYTVEVLKGLKSGKYSLNKNFRFSFKVSGSYNKNSFSKYTVTLDEINSFIPSEKPKIQLDDYNKNNIDVSLYKFNSINEFKNAVDARNANVEKLNKVYTKKLKVKKSNSFNSSLVELDKTFETGYYVAVLALDNYKIQQLIQITDIQNYVITTKNDTLVWTIKDGKVKQGVKVEFNGKTVVSDKEGIAKFENINSGNNDKTYITIDKDSKYPAVVLVENYGKNSYPNAYIYTDRPIYKNTDTIKIWGYVPLGEFEEKITNDFVVKYGNSKKKVKVDKNGVFITEIALNNNVDDEYFDIELCYKDECLASRYLEIYDYVKPTYSYEIDIKKQVYIPGEKLKFDVNVEHITGIPAVSKTVSARVFDKVYKAKTSSKGIAHFEIDVPFSKNSIETYDKIEVFTGNYEDYNSVIMATKNILIMNYDVIIDSKVSGTNNNYNIELNASKLDIDKITKEFDGYYLADVENYIKTKYDSDLVVRVYKETKVRKVIDTYYDDYEGKMLEEYEWDYDSEVIDTHKVSLKNGTVTLKNLKYNTINEEDKIVEYTLEISIKDTKGKIYQGYNYIYIDNYKNSENENYTIYDRGLSYGFKVDDKKSIKDESFEYFLQNEKGENITNEGQILTVFYKEGIVSNTLTTNKTLNSKFNEDFFPGIYLAGAYLLNGKVYAINSTYKDYNEEDKKLNVIIKSEKEEYSPGDNVKLEIEVKDKSGKNKEANLNISVVDEAVFAVKDDETDLLDQIYMDRYYEMYQVSTNRKYYLDGGPGYGDTSGGNAGRYNFKDTVYFASVKTNNSGKATVSFKLPDNITKYRITVHAANKDQYLGVNTNSITSTQKFFIESVVPTNVKYTDDLVINAIAQGNNLNGKVEYIFKLDDKELKQTANVGEYTSVNFGKISIGEHIISITAKNNEFTDKISYKVKIVGNTQEVPEKITTNIGNATNIKATKNPITLEIYDKKLELYLKYLDRLSAKYTSRIDTQIGVFEASRLQSKYYDLDNEFVYADLSDYHTDDNLINKDKKSSSDVLLTAIVNKYAKKYFKTVDISDFNQILLNNKSSSKDVYSAYLGLASTGNITLSSLDYLKNIKTNKNDIEQIILALSYAFIGDYDTSQGIYKSLKISIDKNIVLLNGKEIKNDDTVSLIAILTSMIDKEISNKIIDVLIDKDSTSMYLNFAIISYLENNTEQIEKNKSVTINYGKTTKKIDINGLKVEKLTLDNDTLQNIKFTNASKDLKLTYYYTTGIDTINSKKIKKDVSVSINKEIKHSNQANLNIKYKNKSDNDIQLRIAIPHGLALDKENLNLDIHTHIINEKKDYIIIGISSKKENININLPFIAINKGSYVIEPVVIYNDDMYHISNKLNIKIK